MKINWAQDHYKGNVPFNKSIQYDTFEILYPSSVIVNKINTFKTVDPNKPLLFISLKKLLFKKFLFAIFWGITLALCMDKSSLEITFGGVELSLVASFSSYIGSSSYNIVSCTNSLPCNNSWVNQNRYHKYLPNSLALHSSQYLQERPIKHPHLTPSWI